LNWFLFLSLSCCRCRVPTLSSSSDLPHQICKKPVLKPWVTLQKYNNSITRSAKIQQSAMLTFAWSLLHLHDLHRGTGSLALFWFSSRWLHLLQHVLLELLYGVLEWNG
jgi:hypothetical protein